MADAEDRLHVIAREMRAAVDNIQSYHWTFDDALTACDALLDEAIGNGAFGESEYESLKINLNLLKHKLEHFVGERTLEVVWWLRETGKISGKRSDWADAFEQIRGFLADLIGQQSSTAISEKPVAPPHYQRDAYLSFVKAIRENPLLAETKLLSIYNWIKTNGVEIDGRAYTPPAFETWQRYRRAGERIAKTGK